MRKKRTSPPDGPAAYELNGPDNSKKKRCLITPPLYDAGASTASLPKITVAEHRVLALVARARTNKEIAKDLGISPATVKRHMEKILTKLGLRNRVEAAIYGLTLNGCPHQARSGCAFRQQRPGGDGPPFPWTDYP